MSEKTKEIHLDEKAKNRITVLFRHINGDDENNDNQILVHDKTLPRCNEESLEDTTNEEYSTNYKRQIERIKIIESL